MPDAAFADYKHLAARIYLLMTVSLEGHSIDDVPLVIVVVFDVVGAVLVGVDIIYPSWNFARF